MVAIADEFFARFLQYGKRWKDYQDLQQKPRDFKTVVYVFTGPTGTGKTRSVHAAHPDLWTACDPKLQWFDGYNGQEAVLIDDFDGSSCSITFLLKLFDRFKMQVPVKGSHVNWGPKWLFITSNILLADWFGSACDEHKAALFRRCDVVVGFPTDISAIDFRIEPEKNE